MTLKNLILPLFPKRFFKNLKKLLNKLIQKKKNMVEATNFQKTKKSVKKDAIKFNGDLL